MDLPGFGEVGKGWDLRKTIDDYLGHFDFRGKRVLDVGTASGFLTFEMEKRGAEVVSFDMASRAQWQLVPFRAKGFDVPRMHSAFEKRADDSRRLLADTSSPEFTRSRLLWRHLQYSRRDRSVRRGGPRHGAPAFAGTVLRPGADRAAKQGRGQATKSFVDVSFSDSQAKPWEHRDQLMSKPSLCFGAFVSRRRTPARVVASPHPASRSELSSLISGLRISAQLGAPQRSPLGVCACFGDMRAGLEVVCDQRRSRRVVPGARHAPGELHDVLTPEAGGAHAAD